MVLCTFSNKQYGKTARDIAEEKGYKQIVEKLKFVTETEDHANLMSEDEQESHSEEAAESRNGDIESRGVLQRMRDWFTDSLVSRSYCHSIIVVV